MSTPVFGFKDIDQTKRTVVGSKAANLAELSGIEGVRVPEGFCISTEVFDRLIVDTAAMGEFLDQLSLLTVEDRAKIGELCSEIRRVIEGIAVPEDVKEEITRFLARLGENNAYAVRSSATAEDLPTASFAGQLDTYLNVVGKESVLHHIRKCWASLFTDRAVIYRLRNGFDHRNVHLAVLIQKMVFPQASGIMFTADPVTSNRNVLSIDASFGLGEALVAGLVNADNYKVRSSKVIRKTIATKKLAVSASKDEGGGTIGQEIEPERQDRQTLADEQILQLERIGRKIEKHFGHPQDIEWCLVDDTFYTVQSRPITTLYPIPEAGDRENHVYISVGHQQMMTDPIKPLGISIWQLTAARPMFKAGGRLFVDVTHQLASAGSREILLHAMGEHDPLMKDALVTITERDFIKSVSGEANPQGPSKSNKEKSPGASQAQAEHDPDIALDLIKRSEASTEALKQNIQAKSGPDLFDFILKDIRQLKKILFDPQSSKMIVAAINASSWINEKMRAWLGEKNATDTLSQSAPNNITSEMGLALLDVADVIRPYPEVIGYLQLVKDDNFLDKLVPLEGGPEARDAVAAFLDKYGMRCAGEIDITRTRWSEKPITLVPMILSNIKNFERGAGHWRFEQGRLEASKKEQELLDRLRQLPDGEQKAKETKSMIDLVRNFIGYREYPKYGMIKRYFIYRQALLKEAERLVQAGILHEKEDIYYLTFEEFHAVARTHKPDYRVISKRKDEYETYAKLTPPRVITSEGEIIAGAYKRENLPAKAMAGLPVSSGVIEGRARVILHIEDADLEDGDILVTSFTDPSWTPLFVSVKGLVTEVGGMMTHGAVIAREYGLPAVIGVENATTRINDGQKIRVNGTEGYVEILS